MTERPDVERILNEIDDTLASCGAEDPPPEDKLNLAGLIDTIERASDMNLVPDTITNDPGDDTDRTPEPDPTDVT